MVDLWVECRRFAFDIITDIMVYAIALIIFSQSSHFMSQVTAENGFDFTASGSPFLCTTVCLHYKITAFFPRSNRFWPYPSPVLELFLPSFSTLASRKSPSS